MTAPRRTARKTRSWLGLPPSPTVPPARDREAVSDSPDAGVPRLTVLATLCAGLWWLVLATRAMADVDAPVAGTETPLLGAAFESPAVTLALAACAFWESYLIWGCIQTLAAARLVSTFDIVELEKLLDEKRYSDALRFCESRGRYYTRLVGAALSSAHRGKDAMNLALETMIETEERRGMDWIHSLGTLAGAVVLVGLFGLCANALHALTLDPASQQKMLLPLTRAAFLCPAFACVVALPAFIMEATYSRRLPQIHARVRHEAARVITRIES